MARKKATDESPSLADKILEEAKGKFTIALVVGVNAEGNLDITSTNNNYPILQWLLSKAVFELHIHEKNSQNSRVIEEEAA